MAIQAVSMVKATAPSSTPPSLSPLGHSIGLRGPTDRFALKSSFFSPSLHLLLPPQLLPPAVPKFTMRVASKQAYICRDCGYIYNDRTPFEKLPDNYFCPGASDDSVLSTRIRFSLSILVPRFANGVEFSACEVCGAPKRRFRAYEPAVTKNANDKDVRKARKEQLKRDEAIGRALPIAIVVVLVGLAGLYFYLNNAYS
ncbi:hypothetical protein ACLOJK_019593 [Asimina triloba]